MFYEDLKELSVKTFFVFSKEKVDGAMKGRIDVALLESLSGNICSADDFFICGPGEMIDEVSDFLLKKGIEKSHIHFERFTASKKKKQTEQTEGITSNVLVSLDGDDFEFQLSSDGQSILDAAMEAGADVPFSCKGAVCCTCKAKVKEGKVVMDANYSLSKEEVSEGYILTCQAHPITANIVVDYDEM